MNPQLFALLGVAALVAPLHAAAPNTPGAHKQIPCKKNAKLTYDLYLPSGYEAVAKPGFRGYPAVFLSSPQKNPGFRSLEKWADKNGVILVTFNDSENGPTDQIIKVQDAVWESLDDLRIHPTLRFASGFSGAGAASMVLAHRKPKEVAGVILHCHSILIPKLPKTLAISWLYRTKDEYQGFIGFMGSTDVARGAGHFVGEDFQEGGHAWFPTADFTKQLDMQLAYAKLMNPDLTDAERKEFATWPDAVLKAAADGSLTDAQANLLQVLADAPALKSRPTRTPAVNAWTLREVKAIEALTDKKKAFRRITDPLAVRIFAEAKGDAATRAAALRKKLEADPELKAEFLAWRDWLKIRKDYADVAKSNNTAKYQKVKKDAASLAKDKNKTGTFAASLAAEFIK